MVESDDGDDTAALAQTWRPGSRVHGSDHDIVALIVSGGSSAQAQFDHIGWRAPRLASSVQRAREPEWLIYKPMRSAPVGGQEAVRPVAPIGPMETVSRRPNEMDVGTHQPEI